MTTPDNSADSVPQWQARLLLTIGHLAAEHARILDAGWTGFDAVDEGGPEVAWRLHLEALDSERERTEQTALTAGIDAGSIADAAALGQQRSRPRIDAATRALSSPARDDAAAGFYVDMLAVDLWRLERMAAITAARNERIATGRYSFGSDSATEARFAANMNHHHRRATALARAARITPTEGRELWGAAAEPTRREHAIHLEGHDELALIQEWKTYARPATDPAIPPYLPPATGPLTTDPAALPPTPQQMITDAEASLHAQFLDTALARTGPDPATTALGAISAAVDDALPAGSMTPFSDPDYGVEPEPGYTAEYGIDP